MRVIGNNGDDGTKIDKRTMMKTLYTVICNGIDNYEQITSSAEASSTEMGSETQSNQTSTADVQSLLKNSLLPSGEPSSEVNINSNIKYCKRTTSSIKIRKIDKQTNHHTLLHILHQLVSVINSLNAACKKMSRVISYTYKHDFKNF